MITNCPVCGKAFDVLWPHLYRYKMNSNYFCSWTCYRLKQNRKKEDILNKPKQKRPRMAPDEMATAMRIWREGGDIDTYLKEHGITNISKWKANARARKPAETPKTAGEAMAAMKETADTFFSQCEDMGLKTEAPTVHLDGPLLIETPEASMVKIVETPKSGRSAGIEYKVTGISTAIGDFQFYKKSGYLDWTPIGENSVISMSLEEWRELLTQLPAVANVLEVEL